MEILDALDVLNKYYSHSELQSLYNLQKFDGSETDTNKKLRYNAKLLRDKALEVCEKHEQERIYAAAKEFERTAREADSQR